MTRFANALSSDDNSAKKKANNKTVEGILHLTHLRLTNLPLINLSLVNQIPKLLSLSPNQC